MGREGFEPPNALRDLIYSQAPLATWIPARGERGIVAAGGAGSTSIAIASTHHLNSFNSRGRKPAVAFEHGAPRLVETAGFRPRLFKASRRMMPPR